MSDRDELGMAGVRVARWGAHDELGINGCVSLAVVRFVPCNKGDFAVHLLFTPSTTHFGFILFHFSMI